MKRGTPRHPKVSDFAVRLKVGHHTAVGLLELLWHFAAEFAHAGDIGRYTDAAIANALSWEGDPAMLVSCLHDAGWLDRCCCHRLRIHDWPDHADQTVQRVLSKRNQGFLKCYDDPSICLEKTSQPSPSPSPSPSPIPSPSPLAGEGEDPASLAPPARGKVELAIVVDTLHSAWLRKTGLKANSMTYNREWLRFIDKGHTQQELELVIDHIQWLNRDREPRYRISLAIGRLLEGDVSFPDRLIEATAWKTPPRRNAVASGESSSGWTKEQQKAIIAASNARHEQEMAAAAAATPPPP